jgi:hypothetical protein
LADVCLLVDWENLPTERNYKVVDYKKHKYSTSVSYPSYKSTYDRSFLYDDDDDDGVSDYYDRKRKNKFKVKKGGKSYYDSGNELDEIGDKYKVVSRNGKYNCYKQKFLSSEMTEKELKIAKKQTTRFMI